jgi:hypothetical protein
MTLPTNQNDEGDRRVMQPGRVSVTDSTFRLTVPPGEGMFYAAPRSPETSYTRARLSKADQGRVDDRFIPLTAFNTYKIVDVPDTAEPFTVELKLTRGKSRISIDKNLRPNHWLDTGRALIDILLQHPAEVRDLGDVTVKVVPE